MRILLVILMVVGFIGGAAQSAQADVAATNQINALRAENGKKPLRYSTQLEAAALAHASDMAQNGFFAHRGSSGSKPSQRVTAQGYCWKFVAENIAQGQRTLMDVMQAWAASPPHMKNMLNRKAREFGVVKGPGGNWVMVLARPC